MPTTEKKAAPSPLDGTPADQGMLLRVFAYKKGDIFFACCLDLNLVSQGKTIEESLANLKETVVFHLGTELQEGKTFDQIKRAAPLYFRLKFIQVSLIVMGSIFFRRLSNKYRLALSTYRGHDLFPYEYLTA